MIDKFVGASALCKNWHCIFLSIFLQIAKWSQEGPMQILFDQSKLDRILARAVSIPHVCIVLRPIQFLKSSSQSWKEMTSCRKISFHLLWFTHKVPISNVHTRWNKTFTFDFNVRYLAQKLNFVHHLCIFYLLRGKLILFLKQNWLSVGCSPVGNLFAQNCVQLLPATLSMAIQHNLTHLTGQIPEILIFKHLCKERIF